MEVWTTKMFPIFIGLIAICFCLTRAIYADVDFDACVGMWLFDEGGGKVAKDQTENGNDGTFAPVSGDTTALPTWSKDTP